MYYQASDPSRLEMPINKIEVFVYSSADSTGDRKERNDNVVVSTGAVSELRLSGGSQ